VGLRLEAQENAKAEGAEVDEVDVQALHAPPDCRFLVDETTSKFPRLRLPVNEGNTYPPLNPNPAAWCACGWESEAHPTLRRSEGGPRAKDTTSEASSREGSIPTGTSDSNDSGNSGDTVEGEAEDNGSSEACVLCGACYWAGHLTHLDVDWLYDVNCYGEVRGDLVFFRCHTCEVDCCLSCRLHCHLEHDCSPADFFSSDERDGEIFSCGCRGGCAIAEVVEPARAAAARARGAELGFFTTAAFNPAVDVTERADGAKIARTMAKVDVTCDHFIHYVCERCVAQHPWLLDRERLRGCLSDGAASLPELPREVALARPVSCAHHDASIGAESVGHHKETARHGAVLPGSLFSELVCQCDTCQAEFRRRIPGCGSLDVPIELFFNTTRTCTNCHATVTGEGYVCVTCELSAAADSLGGSYVLCPSCYAIRGDVAHDPTHTFDVDSGENLFRLFTASLVQQLDPAAQAWMLDHWHEAQGLFFDYVRENFGSRRLRDVDGTSSDGTSSLRSSRR
jgi:hypothetical protein